MSGSISLNSVEKAIEAGKARAADLGIAFTIAVLDGGAHGTVIGAVGVGGGYPDQDHEVAEAVKAAL
jgi:uncharacterized protein GlcG (DUF336 family)